MTDLGASAVWPDRPQAMGLVRWLVGAALDPEAYRLRVVLWPLLLGAGLTLLLVAQPFGRPRPDLAALVRRLNEEGPIGAVGAPSGHTGHRLYASRALEGLLRPILDDFGRLLRGGLRRLGLPDVAGARGAGGGPESLERALALVWPGMEPAQFLGHKVVLAAFGAGLLPLLNALDLAPWGAWPLWAWGLGLLAGFFAPDWALARRLARRRADVLQELPALVDLLTLATSAGMAMEQALRLVAERSGGVVARELQQVAREATLGRHTLVEALEAMAERNGVDELGALVGRLRAAHEQGIQLAETLATQAESLRERRRLLLMEAGGRASVRMVLPVALLIFPVTFVILLFPAVVTLLNLAR